MKNLEESTLNFLICSTVKGLLNDLRGSCVQIFHINALKIWFGHGLGMICMDFAQVENLRLSSDLKTLLNTKLRRLVRHL